MSDNVEFGATIDEPYVKKDKNTKFRKTEFIQLGQGEHLIRILEPMETKVYAHYVGWSWLKCLGDECPICENNKKILYEHPEDYREVKGWNPRRDRYSINVLDKTPARVCPKCGVEKKDANVSNCPACGTPMNALAPLNKVKVLSRGSTLFDDLKTMSRAIRDADDKRIDIRLYDFRLMVRGTGRDTTITPVPVYIPGRESEPSFEGELFDLSKAAIELNREEMSDVAFNNAALKDIFTMRRAKKQLEESNFVNTDIEQEMNDSLGEIFKA